MILIIILIISSLNGDICPGYTLFSPLQNQGGGNYNTYLIDNEGNYIVKDIFRWMQTGKTPDGKYAGHMVPCNYVPSFFEDVVLNKLPFPKSHFVSHDWKKKQAA